MISPGWCRLMAACNAEMNRRLIRWTIPRGAPFDPAGAAEPEKPRGLRGACIGGLGVPLLHRMAAAAAYRHSEDGRNLLRAVLPDEAASIG